jgi:hypothetical protein
MKKFIKSVLNMELANDNSGIEKPSDWQPGMDREFCNANGDVDSSSLGYDFSIRTTTYLRTKSIQQKFYKVPPADFLTVEVGEGAFMEAITQNLEYRLAGDFESGNVNVTANKTEIPQVQAGISPKTYPLVSWAMGYGYSLVEIRKALQSNRWDKIGALTDALKEVWDLGIQKITFLGSKSVAGVYGLLTLPDPGTDTGVMITGPISGLSVEDFVTFVQLLIADYFKYSNYTQMPNKFVMPTDDFLGLVTPTSSAFPIVNKLQYLLDAFKAATGNNDFKILHTAYNMAANNAGYVSTNGTNRYALYNDNPECVRLSIPVQFNLTPAGTQNNFNWQGAAYGQYGGVENYRAREIKYYDRTN